MAPVLSKLSQKVEQPLNRYGLRMGNELLYNGIDANEDLQIYKISLSSGASVQLTDGESWSYLGDWFDPAYALPVFTSTAVVEHSMGGNEKEIGVSCQLEM